MGRVSIKLDGFDLEKLITGETLKFSVHISPVDQITIETTPNAISNLKSLIYQSSDNLPLNPKSFTDICVTNQILKDRE